MSIWNTNDSHYRKCFLTSTSFFADWFEETEDSGNSFPSCEHLLRDNWYVADPIPLDVVNEGIPENQQLDPAYCNQVRYESVIGCIEMRFVFTD